MYKEYFNNLHGMIIPHAGYEYAGSARKIILDNLVKKDRDVRYIIYLAALHNPANTTNKVLVLKNNINFKELINKNYQVDNIPEGGLNEHSYKWVENEIKHYFNKAEIIWGAYLALLDGAVEISGAGYYNFFARASFS